MSKWEMVRLGDVCKFINGDRGKNYPSSKDFVSEGVSFINAGHIKGKSIDYSDMNYITEDRYEILGSGKVEPNDILYCLRGSLGKHALVSHGKGAIASSLVILRSDSRNVSCHFLLHCLGSELIRKQQVKANNGSSQPNLSAASVKDFRIPLPPLERQKHIADTLDKTQEIIDGYKKQLEELDNLIKANFYDLFGDPVTNEKGWDKRRLDEVAEIITGNTPPRADKDNYGNYIEWIKSDNIKKENIYLTHAAEFLSEKGYSVGRYVEENSILMTCIAGSISAIGNVAITDRKVAFNQQINGIIPINCNYYYLYVLFMQTQKYIQSTINMSLKGILSKGKLSKLEFTFPPLQLQNKFAEIVTNIEAQKAIVKQSIKEAETLFNSLMSKYFD